MSGPSTAEIAALTAMPVRDRAEAEAFITELNRLGLAYHFDDGAHECLFGNNLVDEAEASYIEGQIGLCYDAWTASGADLKHDCPIGFLLTCEGVCAP